MWDNCSLYLSKTYRMNLSPYTRHFYWLCVSSNDLHGHVINPFIKGKRFRNSWTTWRPWQTKMSNPKWNAWGTQWIYVGKVGYSRKYPHTPHGQHWKSCDKCSLSLTGILWISPNFCEFWPKFKKKPKSCKSLEFPKILNQKDLKSCKDCYR